MILSNHEVLQNDIDSGKISWQDEKYFTKWQSEVMGELKLNLGETDDNVKEETEEDAPTDIAFTEELHDDLVCIKFKLEKDSKEDEIIKKKSVI